jgi:hypothetical protein
MRLYFVVCNSDMVQIGAIKVFTDACNATIDMDERPKSAPTVSPRQQLFKRGVFVITFASIRHFSVTTAPVKPLLRFILLLRRQKPFTLRFSIPEILVNLRITYTGSFPW